MRENTCCTLDKSCHIVTKVNNMRNLPAAILILLTFNSASKAAVTDQSEQKQVSVYIVQIRYLQKLIITDCPESLQTNQLASARSLDTLKRQLNTLLRQLTECRQKKAGATTPNKSMTVVQPEECITAKNLTQGWRRIHTGKMVYPPGEDHSHQSGFACDLHKDLKWFRFTGDAGEKRDQYF